jgi:competence protein ComEC
MRNYIVYLLLILLIVFRYFMTRPVYKDGDRVRITGSVLSDPIRYPSSQYVKLAGLKIYLPAFPEISYGDNISVEGMVNGDKLDNPKLIKIYETKSFLSDFRNKIIDFYNSALPQPESGLIGGVTLGSKGALTQEFYNQTKLTGVAHVVVASGTNVTFVVSFLMGVLTLFLPRRRAIFFVILGIIMYLFISGFDAPLIRAAIMSSALFLGQETGRLVSSWRIFFITASLMLIYRPDWLIDIGFMLSFASTASIMLFQKRINGWLGRVPGIIREDFSTTLSAQIGVAPILFVTFGQFNILSPLINALVLWTVPGTMILGAVGGVVGLIIPGLGKILLYLAYPMLWWFCKVVEIFQ